MGRRDNGQTGGSLVPVAPVVGQADGEGAEFAFDVPPGWTIHFDARLNAIDASGASTSGLLHAGDAADAQPHELGRVDLMFAHVPAADHEILEARAFRTLAAASVAAGLEDAGIAALASGA